MHAHTQYVCCQDDGPPTLFFIMLTKERRLHWRLYPLLLKHVFWTSTPAHSLSFEVWAPPTHHWLTVHPDDPFLISEGHDFMVVRHNGNPSAQGFVHFAALADEQSTTPVEVSCDDNQALVQY